jgi:excisionase family DNA binding protein
MQEMMTPDQVARYLQVNRATVYRLIRQGRLPAIQLGRIYRLERKEVQKFTDRSSIRGPAMDRLFAAISSIHSRNPDVDGDALLEYLERLDEERKQAQRAAG